MKLLLEGPIKTEILEGATYVDEPMYKTVPVYCGKEPMEGEVFKHYKRTPLRWMKPVNGKLVPR